MRPRSPLAPPWRVHIAVPGLLATAIEERREKFSYKSFSPFAVELVCFDLRVRRDHIVTLPFFREPPEVQNAIDRQIVHHYKPDSPRNKELLYRILRDEPWLPPVGNFVEGTYQSFRDHVRFPGKLRPLIKQRWREQGYDSISTYLTSLIRYDLILSGPHHYFDGKDKHPEVLAALDAETFTAFHVGKRQKILLDYLVEEAAGRKLTPEETEAELRRLASLIRENAVRSQKAYEKRIAEERARELKRLQPWRQRC